MGKLRKRLTKTKYAKKYAKKRAALFNTESVTIPTPEPVTAEVEKAEKKEPEVTTECSLPEPEPVQEITEPAPKPNALKEVATAPLKKKRRRRSSSRKAKASTKKANS